MEQYYRVVYKMRKEDVSDNLLSLPSKFQCYYEHEPIGKNWTKSYKEYLTILESLKKPTESKIRNILPKETADEMLKGYCYKCSSLFNTIYFIDDDNSYCEDCLKLVYSTYLKRLKEKFDECYTIASSVKDLTKENHQMILLLDDSISMLEKPIEHLRWWFERDED